MVEIFPQLHKNNAGVFDYKIKQQNIDFTESSTVEQINAVKYSPCSIFFSSLATYT